MRLIQSRSFRLLFAVLTVLVAGGFAARGASGPPSAQDPVLIASPAYVCWHYDGSRWACPDSTARFFMIARGNEVASAVLTVTLVDGRRVRKSLPAGVDAIFLTPEGMEILAEHYDGKDTTKAAGVRRSIAVARRTIGTR